MRRNYLGRVLLAVVFSLSSLTLYAEDSAPVYDVDNLPSEFDGQPDSGATTSPLPAPEHSFAAPSSSLDQRLGRLERQMNTFQRSSSGSARVETLQTEVQSLRGQVEDLTHQIKQLQSQVRTMYTDLDKRLSQQPTSMAPHQDQKVPDNKPDQNPKISQPSSSKLPVVASTSTPAKSNPVAAADPQPNLAEEQQTYQTAYDLIKAKKYGDAISSLQKMLQKYPSGQFAANAHYWLGELYALTGKNDQSTMEFSSVITQFPDSAKVPEAQLKLGLILVSESKWSEAKSAFKKVINKYPGTASSRLALQQLKQLKATGH